MSVGAARVVLLAVYLEDQPAIDEEIDSADAGYVYLALQKDAEEVQAQANQRLEAAVGIRSCNVHQPSRACGDRGANANASRSGEHPLTPCGLVRREEDLFPTAMQDVNQSGLHVDEAERWRPVEEVADASAAEMLVDSPATADPDVRMLVLAEYPDAALAQRRSTGERTAVHGGRPDTRIERGSGEESRTKPLDSACIDGLPQRRPRDAVLLKTGAASEAAEGGEDGEGCKHPPSLAWRPSG